MGWRDILYRLGNETETHFDSLKLQWRQKMGWFNHVHILPYTTYATQTEIYLKGRVLENRDTTHTERDDMWRNLVNMYKRFNSTEIAGALMRVTINNESHELLSDEDGYFQANIPLTSPLPAEELWFHPVIELLEAKVPFEKPLLSRAGVMTPPITAQFGVISDIDDTILRTNATSLLKAAYLTFLNNARTRLPFEGVAAFYQALQSGITGTNFNPIFYVSSSPWNLFDLLTDFKEINKIPKGPLLLRDIGFTEKKLFSEDHHTHKTKAITDILNKFPLLPFILVGDSGQQDPEIYAQIVKDFPGRILAIYIRDVTLDERDQQVKKISEGLLEHKVEMIYTENSFAAAEHAVQKGFIHPGSLSFIKKEKKLDETVKPTVEELVEREVKKRD